MGLASTLQIMVVPGECRQHRNGKPTSPLAMRKNRLQRDRTSYEEAIPHAVSASFGGHVVARVQRRTVRSVAKFSLGVHPGTAVRGDGHGTPLASRQGMRPCGAWRCGHCAHRLLGGRCALRQSRLDRESKGTPSFGIPCRRNARHCCDRMARRARALDGDVGLYDCDACATRARHRLGATPAMVGLAHLAGPDRGAAASGPIRSGTRGLRARERFNFRDEYASRRACSAEAVSDDRPLRRSHHEP